MYIKYLKDCEKFIAGDGSILRELLHAEKGDFKFRYSLAHAIVKPKEVTKPHKLSTTEVYYLLEGKGVMHINEESKEVFPKCAIYIPPDSTQYIENTGDSDLVFLCIVDPAWQNNDENIICK